jgi:hypothetical protein
MAALFELLAIHVCNVNRTQNISHSNYILYAKIILDLKL